MRRVRGWLRMVATGGEYPLPTSEASYKAHSDLIDVVIPAHGGKLQADGTWLQQPERLESEWAQELRGLAQAAGQTYVPSVGASGAALLAVLDNVALQEAAASNLVTLAQTRFDAPWDAVMLDVADVPEEYRDTYGDFVLLLSTRVRQAGQQFHMAYYGVKWGHPDYFDPHVAAQAADHYDCYCYAPGSNWDYASTVRGLEYALTCGVPAQRMSLGLAGYSSYWPVTGLTHRHDITHIQAIELVRRFNSFVQWIEYDGKLIRNKYADVGQGHLWISDGDVIRSRLELVERLGLAGVMLFTPGLESESTWQAIADWKGGAL